jgi:hypothetical protein
MDMLFCWILHFSLIFGGFKRNKEENQMTSCIANKWWHFFSSIVQMPKTMTLGMKMNKAGRANQRSFGAHGMKLHSRAAFAMLHFGVHCTVPWVFECWICCWCIGDAALSVVDWDPIFLHHFPPTSHPRVPVEVLGKVVW